MLAEPIFGTSTHGSSIFNSVFIHFQDTSFYKKEKKLKSLLFLFFLFLPLLLCRPSVSILLDTERKRKKEKKKKLFQQAKAR